MNNKHLITEGLDYHDMVNQIIPVVGIDEYEAKMGNDKDIVTLSFIVKSQGVGEDFVDWLERGYDFVLDASVSDGEAEFGKWLVFVEMHRQNSVSAQVIEILEDLKTLSDLKLSDWEIKVDDKKHKADEATIKQLVILNPAEYEDEEEEVDAETEKGLNEMRHRAGVDLKKIHKDDSYIKNIKAMAGY